jgi:spore coat protein U-like protein
VSWHSLSSVACITTTGGWRDTHGVVWIEKVASTAGVDSLSYDIYVDAAHTVVWSSTPVAVVPLDNTAVDFYGSIFALQDVSVGSYTDTVVVTLNF